MGWVMQWRLMNQPRQVTAEELMTACTELSPKEADQWQAWWVHNNVPTIIEEAELLRAQVTR